MPARRPCPGGKGKKRVCWARDGSDFCSWHDPALKHQRRLNGCVRHKVPSVSLVRDKPIREGGHRYPHLRLVDGNGQPDRGRNWGPTKGEKIEAWVERFEAKLAEPIPPDAVDEIKRALRAILLTSPHVPARVMASRVLSDMLQSPKDGDGDALPPDPDAAFAEDGALRQ